MIVYRPAHLRDAEAISQLETILAEKFITPEYSASGAAVLLDSFSPEETRARMRQGFLYFVAVERREIVGVSSLRNHSHLYHLFVAESHQGRGIARQLWERARDAALAAGNPGRITVNSSRYAVPVYLRLGFVEAGGMTTQSEIACQPMVWTGSPDRQREEDPKI